MKLYTDNISKVLYATDASAYRDIPYGVCYPADLDDIQTAIKEVRLKGVTLIPRCAGTSLAGQVVGSGLVADVSKHLNKIIAFNREEQWVKVQPGVVLDELNAEAAKFGLFFGPETSTSNRCCIGGMVGNNSCGSHSIVYGSTRDHLLEAKVVLSDGSLAEFSQKRAGEVMALIKGRGIDAFVPTSLEESIYLQLLKWAYNGDFLSKVNEVYPDKKLRRRNCGYALDIVLNDIAQGRVPNLCSLLAGSEGTLAFAYELKLNLVPLPPKEKVVVCAHCDTLEKVFRANLIALEFGPKAVELMDANILELSKKNIAQNRNRFFVNGDPAAILIVELAEDSAAKLEGKADAVEKSLMESKLVYHCSRVYGKDISRVWALRKAGLGLLSGMKGDSKPVSVIEDTAVCPDRLPKYINDFSEMLKIHGLSCVYHAHIGTGELHLRPIINIKDEEGRKMFRSVAQETAFLVKKHKGSLSGEHGDGRLRGEFIKIMYGEEIYEALRALKHTWDSFGVLNAGKIVDTPPMDTCLRYDVGQKYAASEFLKDTYFDFSESKGIFCAVEQCNGAGDCRKSEKIGGVLCPAFKAGKEERFATRARANIMREILTRGSLDSSVKNPFEDDSVYELLNECLSCKACKSECPSNVDMTRLKAEFFQHRFDSKGVPFRNYMVAHMAFFQKIGALVPDIYNFFASWSVSSQILKSMLKFASDREIPAVSRHTLRALARRMQQGDSNVYKNGRVYLFADEFTNYLEAEIGVTFINLLNKLGYEVAIPKHYESGRAALSKGMLKVARKFAHRNVAVLKGVISASTPLVGIEPSCIMSFRDEYPALLRGSEREDAITLAKNCLLYDEFFMREVEAGRITADSFTDEARTIWLHGHCHQKALVGTELSAKMLSLPRNYKVNVIPSGCCGMAGSFGYEKEHYETSVEIGEQVLMPAVREARLKDAECIIAAPGTSCRTQIMGRTRVKALHPVEVMEGAVKGE